VVGRFEEIRPGASFERIVRDLRALVVEGGPSAVRVCS
jgi:hypothetical protein